MPNLIPSPLERACRQQDLVPPARLADCHAVLIGVGAIGRQVALQLAALGIPRLTLFDPQTVQVENLAPQGYFEEDLGRPKVEATAALCRKIYPAIELWPKAERFRISAAQNLAAGPRQVVFACVDQIATRRRLWEAFRLRAALFIDGRLNGEVIRVLAADPLASDPYYPKTLFAAEDAYAGACTARSTIYAAAIAAGLMVGQLTKWLRASPGDPDLILNLLASELLAAAVPSP